MVATDMLRTEHRYVPSSTAGKALLLLVCRLEVIIQGVLNRRLESNVASEDSQLEKDLGEQPQGISPRKRLFAGGVSRALRITPHIHWLRGASGKKRNT